MKIKLIIAYDGTNYYGWQRQKNHLSIQESIEGILSKLLQADIKIHGAGRTDRGVHSKGQVASCDIPIQTNTSKLIHSMNSLLPKDIRILSIHKERKDFHARYSSISKKYLYRIDTTILLDPFLRHNHYHHPFPLDLSHIQKAVPLFLGTQDYSSFANYLGKNSPQPSPIKTIYSIEIKEHSSGFSIAYHGDGFLYKMVRNITGALIDIGEKKISLNQLSDIIARKSNTHQLRQAPAHGLCLESVQYPT